MNLGVFTKVFPRPTLGESLAEISREGLSVAQMNMSSVGMSSLPEVIPPVTCDEINRATQATGITLAAVSGTFNPTHPDQHVRQDGLRRARIMIGACRQFGVDVVTLSTGTRDRNDPWRAHPDNGTRAAWRDLLVSYAELLEAADRADVTLAFEPEPSNVVSSARLGRRLMEELGSPHLRVVLDAANLAVGSHSRREATQLVDQAFMDLDGSVAVAHAKDITGDGQFVAAGEGLLDYSHYLARLQALNPVPPLILHGLPESQCPSSVSFLRRTLSELNG